MSSKSILAWLFSHLRPYKKYVAIALSALLFSSLAWLLLGQGIKYVIDEGFIDGNTEALKTFLFAVLGIVFIGSIATYYRFYWMVWIGERVCADIRKHLFRHLLGLPPSFFENTKTGEIISRFTSDTTLLQSVVGTGFSMALRSLVMFLGALVLMAITSFKLTILVFIAVPFILVPIRILGNKVREYSKSSQDKVAQVGGMIDENLHEIHTVQAYNYQSTSMQGFFERVESVMEHASMRIRYRALLISIVMLISLSAIIVVAYVGAMLVIDQQISAGELTAFVFYAVLAGGAIATISEVIGELQKAAGASERIIELMQETSVIVDDGKIGATELTQAYGKHSEVISVNNVSFAYPSSSKILCENKTIEAKNAINGLNMRVLCGQKVAIVGHSGAGKSTLFELFQRFYDVNEGQILINNMPIQTIQLNALRAQFALVPQDPVVFSGTVYENIRFSNTRASQRDIEQAAKLAFADEFIRQLPQGYDSELGERGVKLSGGQKQRIAIARAIAANRPILLLDEATSSLDPASENLVKQALEKLMTNKTTIIIAHRLSTVMNADLIVVMEKGQVIATGTHKNLYTQSKHYKEFVDLQLAD